MADSKEVRRLKELAFEMRKKLINLCGCYDGIVHIGGDLSMTDLLIGLYHHGMKVDPKDIKLNCNWEWVVVTIDRFHLH